MTNERRQGQTNDPPAVSSPWSSPSESSNEARESSGDAAAEDAARVELEGYVDGDAGSVRALIESRTYVAMLASKTDGVRDNLQVAPVNGGHVFRWRDILAEHRQLRDDPALTGRVYLADSTLYGDRRVDPNSGRRYLVTVYDGGFSDRAEVLGFCNTHFAHLGPVERANTCAPSQMQAS